MKNPFTALLVMTFPVFSAVPYVFVPSSPARAAEVNSNFFSLDSHIASVGVYLDSFRLQNSKQQIAIDSLRRIGAAIVKSEYDTRIYSDALYSGNVYVRSSESYPNLNIDNTGCYWKNQSGRNYYMGVNSDGSFGIGTQTPNGMGPGHYPLLSFSAEDRNTLKFDHSTAFSGDAIFESKIVGKPETGRYPSAVFNTGYNLIPLDSLAKIVSVTKALPEMPTAYEVNSAGIDLVQMNLLLIKKIEEMTLYMLNQEVRIKALEAKP